MGLVAPIPIRLEKNGRICLNPKLANKSLFSVKNCRCSGKSKLKRVRLVICLSTSTCEKSGFTVTSKFIDDDNAILASAPMLPSYFVSVFATKSLLTFPIAYGITAMFPPAFLGGLSHIKSPEKASVAILN